MKKLFIVPLLLLVAQGAMAVDRLLIFTVAANYMHPADAGFREIYGNSAFYPDVTGGVRIVSSLYATAGYGWLNRKGKSPNLNLDVAATQTFISGGLGYILHLGGTFSVMLEGGYVYARFKEEALDAVAKGGASGIKADVGLLLLGEEGQIFAGIKAGYIAANVSNPAVKLGGPRIAVCLGIGLFGEY